MDSLFSTSELRTELVNRVRERTGRRVRDLEVELLPQKVVLHGHATSYHIKQLAQHGVRDLLPHVELTNAIVVGS